MTRAQVVAKVGEYCGTPFRHQARVKHHGVDCAGLVICVARELGFVAPDFDINGYGEYVPEEYMRGILGQMMEPVKGRRQLGDVVLICLRGQAQHLGFLTPGGLTHAYFTVGKVAEHPLDDKWKKRIVGAWRFKGVSA